MIAAPVMGLIALAIRLDSPGPALFRHRRIGMNHRRSTPRRDGSDRRPAIALVATVNTYTGTDRRRDEARRKTGDRREIDDFGRPFTLYKFRTMCVDAKDRFPELYDYEYTEEELDTLPIKVLMGGPRGPDGVKQGSDLGSDPRLTRVGRWLRRTSLDELPNFINVFLGDMALVGPRPDIAKQIRYYRAEHMAKLNAKPGLTGLAQVKGRGTLTFHETNEIDIEYLHRRSIRFNLAILLETVRVTLGGHGAY